MKTFARITGALLIVFGLLIVLGAISLGVLGGLRDALRLAGALPAGRWAGLTGLLFLLFFLGYGLRVTGMGQGPFLIADLSARRPLA